MYVYNVDMNIRCGSCDLLFEIKDKTIRCSERNDKIAATSPICSFVLNYKT